MGKKRKEEWKRVGGGENVPAPILKATAGASRVDSFLIGELHRATSHVWALHRDADLAYVDRHRYINQGHSERPTPEGRGRRRIFSRPVQRQLSFHGLNTRSRQLYAVRAPQLRVHAARAVSPHGRLDVLVLEVLLDHFCVTAGRMEGRRPSFLRRTDRGHGRGPALWRRMVAPRTYAGGVRANR